MNIQPEQYEKLGAFYLGRGYDIENRKLEDDLILYDSKDLVTHGVVLGMTGSGKTGLCLTLLEEAAIDGIPVIALDPKGDIGNAMLTFPGLSAEEFEPWVNADDARRKGVTPAEFAGQQADLWRKGLADWGQGPERVRKLKECVDVAIYTPGSSAGLPVSIISSLACPPEAIREDTEAMAERIETTVSSLMGLMGIEADPVQSPEHILLSNILGACWGKGQDVTLEHLVRHIQQPPVRKIGVLDLDSFFPEPKRQALALKLNNLLAAPSFGAWLEGEPLDVQRLFYTHEGRPRLSVISISHLGDAERMFFVALLLNQLLGWMRSQQGTTSLRAIFYMDEIYGYLPPSAMPPSKRPMLLLLKQARAFGLGMLLATQNPVDLDYKALSNIGTWWLGRLQTERDKARVLDGLEGATVGQGKFDRQRMEALLSGLGSRVFLMNNVHEDAPVVFQVRWIMSYLSGPLARDQIKRLMDPRRSGSEAPAAAEAEDDGFLPPGATAAPSARNTFKPALPDGVAECFLSAAADVGSLCYVPAMLRSAEVAFNDPKRGISGTSRITVVNVIDAEKQKVLWDEYIDLPRDLDPAAHDTAAMDGAEYLELPPAALKASTYTAIRKDFAEWVYGNHSTEVGYSPLLQAYANPGEAVDEFKARIGQKARELRDQAVAELREKMTKSVTSLQERATKAEMKVQAQKAQAGAAQLNTVVRLGGSLLGAFFGRKTGISSVTSTITGASTAFRESQEAAAAEAELKRAKEEIAALEQQLVQESDAIQKQYESGTLAVEQVKLTPLKKNIRVTAAGILWLPHERVGGQIRPAWEL